MKKCNILLAVLISTFLLSGSGFAADNYKIDNIHSYIGFSVQHLVITKVRGSFGEYSAKITVDEKKPEKSTVELKIETASINTNNEKRDNHLRNSDFFDAKKFPYITFKSKEVVKKGGNNFVVKGPLTMRGKTKNIEIPLEITDRIKDPYGNTKFGVNGSLKIDRQDWGVSWNKTMDKGGLVVGNEVEIELNIEAVKK